MRETHPTDQRSDPFDRLMALVDRQNKELNRWFMAALVLSPTVIVLAHALFLCLTRR